MSYDLFLRPEADLIDVTLWFAERGYQMSEGQAFYENEKTGVYFAFWLSESEGRVEAAFNLNFFRPDIFALEAEGHVAAFMEAFAPILEDPQVDGMGSGPYSQEGFLRGWNAGNAMAGRVLTEQGVTAGQLPRALNRAVWNWNRSREAYMDRLGSIEMIGVFVPTVLLMEVEGAVGTAVIWTEGVPIALPRVEWIAAVFPRKSAPRWLRYEEIWSLLGGHEQRSNHHFELDGRSFETGFSHHFIREVGPDLEGRLSTLGEPHEVQRWAPGDVIDEEILL